MQQQILKQIKHNITLIFITTLVCMTTTLAYTQPSYFQEVCIQKTNDNIAVFTNIPFANEIFSEAVTLPDQLFINLHPQLKEYQIASPQLRNTYLGLNMLKTDLLLKKRAQELISSFIEVNPTFSEEALKNLSLRFWIEVSSPNVSFFNTPQGKLFFADNINFIVQAEIKENNTPRQIHKVINLVKEKLQQEVNNSDYFATFRKTVKIYLLAKAIQKKYPNLILSNSQHPIWFESDTLKDYFSYSQKVPLISNLSPILIGGIIVDTQNISFLSSFRSTKTKIISIALISQLAFQSVTGIPAAHSAKTADIRLYPKIIKINDQQLDSATQTIIKLIEQYGQNIEKMSQVLEQYKNTNNPYLKKALPLLESITGHIRVERIIYKHVIMHSKFHKRTSEELAQNYKKLQEYLSNAERLLHYIQQLLYKEKRILPNTPTWFYIDSIKDYANSILSKNKIPTSFGEIKQLHSRIEKLAKKFLELRKKWPLPKQEIMETSKKLEKIISQDLYKIALSYLQDVSKTTIELVNSLSEILLNPQIISHAPTYTEKSIKDTIYKLNYAKKKISAINLKAKNFSELESAFSEAYSAYDTIFYEIIQSRPSLQYLLETLLGSGYNKILSSCYQLFKMLNKTILITVEHTTPFPSWFGEDLFIIDKITSVNLAGTIEIKNEHNESVSVPIYRTSIVTYPRIDEFKPPYQSINEMFNVDRPNKDAYLVVLIPKNNKIDGKTLHIYKCNHTLTYTTLSESKEIIELLGMIAMNLTPYIQLPIKKQTIGPIYLEQLFKVAYGNSPALLMLPFPDLTGIGMPFHESLIQFWHKKYADARLKLRPIINKFYKKSMGHDIQTIPDLERKIKKSIYKGKLYPPGLALFDLLIKEVETELSWLDFNPKFMGELTFLLLTQPKKSKSLLEKKQIPQKISNLIETILERQGIIVIGTNILPKHDSKYENAFYYLWLDRKNIAVKKTIITILLGTVLKYSNDFQPIMKKYKQGQISTSNAYKEILKLLKKRLEDIKVSSLNRLQHSKAPNSKGWLDNSTTNLNVRNIFFPKSGLTSKVVDINWKWANESPKNKIKCFINPLFKDGGHIGLTSMQIYANSYPTVAHELVELGLWTYFAKKYLTLSDRQIWEEARQKRETLSKNLEYKGTIRFWIDLNPQLAERIGQKFHEIALLAYNPTLGSGKAKNVTNISDAISIAEKLILEHIKEIDNFLQNKQDNIEKSKTFTNNFLNLAKQFYGQNAYRSNILFTTPENKRELIPFLLYQLYNSAENEGRDDNYTFDDPPSTSPELKKIPYLNLAEQQILQFLTWLDTTYAHKNIPVDLLKHITRSLRIPLEKEAINTRKLYHVAEQLGLVNIPITNNTENTENVGGIKIH